MSTHADKTTNAQAQSRIGKVVVASLIGTSIEWYDYFLYGACAALVFGHLFFPSGEPIVETMTAFASFAVGFVARPLGGVVFGHFGDRLGRKRMLVTSLLVMGTATVCIGLLPTYQTIGVAAPILLILCRLAQGFSAGGEWGGAVLMSAEHSPEKNRGLWAAWPQAGVPVGNLLASGVLLIFSATLSEEAFMQWGWRVPFLLSAALVIVGLWIRLGISESAVFLESQKSKKALRVPALEVIRHYPKQVAIVLGLRVGGDIAYYIFTVVVVTYTVTYLGMPRTAAVLATVVASAVQIVLTPVIGSLSDKVGRRPLFIFGAVMTGIWGFVFFPLLDTGSEGAIISAVVGGVFCLHFMYVPQAAASSELFDTSVRYSGISLGYQLESMIGGGLAPLISVALLGSIDMPSTVSVSIYVGIAAFITLLAAIFLRDATGKSLYGDRGKCADSLAAEK
jgi:metabolite-proton symporter